MSYAQPLNYPPGMPRGMGRGRRRWLAMNDQNDQSDAAGSPDAPSDDEMPTGGHHHGGRRGHGGGRGPGGGRGFGPGPWGGKGPWGPPRGRRRERGDVRAAILLLLSEQPRHGYEILTELADRSDGQWRPSPGSVYPILKRLTRDGLVAPSHEEGRRVFSLTEEGRAVVEAERESWGEPWAQAAPPEPASELWDEGRQLMAAVWQVDQLSQPEQIAAATAVLAEARKSIYRMLAD